MYTFKIWGKVSTPPSPLKQCNMYIEWPVQVTGAGSEFVGEGHIVPSHGPGPAHNV